MGNKSTIIRKTGAKDPKLIVGRNRARHRGAVNDEDHVRAFRFIALGALLAIQAAAQPTTTAPQPTIQRDPQALSLLSRSLAAMTKGVATPTPSSTTTTPAA
jgi:hypothetical protein